MHDRPVRAAIDLAPFLLPEGGEARAAWLLPDKRWQLTILTSRPTRAGWRRLLATYEVDPTAGRARLVGEIGHTIDRDTIVEDVRRRAGGGPPAPPIAIPRRMRVGHTVATAEGAASVTLASCRRTRLGGLSRSAITLTAVEGGGRGGIVLMEGVGEIRVAGAEDRRATFTSAGGGAGREPAWWRDVELVRTRLDTGASSIVF